MTLARLQKVAGLGVAVLDNLPKYLGVYVLNGNFFVVGTSHHLRYLFAGACHYVLVRRYPIWAVGLADDEHDIADRIIFKSLSKDFA